MHTPLEGGNTLQTQGPLKLLVKHGKIFWALRTVLGLENNSLTCILRYTLSSAPVLKNVVLSFYFNILFPAKSYHLYHYPFGYLLLHPSFVPFLSNRGPEKGLLEAEKGATQLPGTMMRAPCQDETARAQPLRVPHGASLFTYDNLWAYCQTSTSSGIWSTSERGGELPDLTENTFINWPQESPTHSRSGPSYISKITLIRVSTLLLKVLKQCGKPLFFFISWL